MKRLFDILASAIVLLILLPFLLVISLLIVLDSSGGIFYRQTRIGKGEQPFGLYKFRTMVTGADRKGKLTIGNRDSRITRVGYTLRKYKLDELPQLLNILKGEMSVVGPRPETPNYVELYTTEQREVLQVLPGLTDYASIEYARESELLAQSDDPETLYIQEIMPAKLALNKQYIADQSLSTDLKIIFRTIAKIFQ